MKVLLKRMKSINLVIIILFLFVGCQSRNHKALCIAIQPYGAIPAKQISQASEALALVYHCHTVVYTSKDLPEDAFVHIKSPRYRADILIKLLSKQVADTISTIIGITNKDISTTKWIAKGIVKQPASTYRDWGIFGLGYMPGKSAVISTYRISANADKQLLKQRLQKIAVHEAGHNFGLPHCKNKSCVMTDAAETIRTIDKVSLALCNKCKKKIKIL